MDSSAHYQTFPLPASLAQQAEAYNTARDREARLLPDDEVRQLPQVPRSHPYYAEWGMRQASLQKALSFLQRGLGYGEST